MRNLLSSKKRLFSLLVILLIALSIPLAVLLSQQQQNINPNAATGADLTITSFQLVDSGGNSRTTFAPNENIYVKFKVKNIGTALGESQDTHTYAAVYSNAATPPAPATASDVQVEMQTGRFGAGTEREYVSTYAGPETNKFRNKKTWKKATAGTYTARVYVNYNNFVTEDPKTNNQATIQYTIADTAYIKGTTSTSVPSGFSGLRCVADQNNVEPNLTACVTEGSSGGKAFAKVTNKGTTAMPIGLASYKAYIPYPKPYPTCEPTACPDEYDWIWTQTIHSAVTYSLPAGQTIYLSVAVPDCAWQIDVFKGSLIPSFTVDGNQWYSGKRTYLDGYYHEIPNCNPIVTTPTPTVPTATVLTPTVITPTVPTPTEITPSPSSCPVPAVVPNVRVTCPYCEEGDAE